MQLHTNPCSINNILEQKYIIKNSEIKHCFYRYILFTNRISV